MAAEVPATQGAMASAPKMLTLLNRDNSVPILRVNMIYRTAVAPLLTWISFDPGMDK